MLTPFSVLNRVLLQDDGFGDGNGYMGDGYSEDPTNLGSGTTSSSNQGFDPTFGSAETSQVADPLGTETGLPSDSGIFGTNGTTDSSTGGENAYLPADEQNQTTGQNDYNTAIPDTVSTPWNSGTEGGGTEYPTGNVPLSNSSSTSSGGGWDPTDTATASSVTGALAGIFGAIGSIFNGTKKSSGGISIGGTTIQIPSTTQKSSGPGSGGGSAGGVTPSLQSVLDSLGLGSKTKQLGKTPPKSTASASSSSLWLILIAGAGLYLITKR